MKALEESSRMLLPSRSAIPMKMGVMLQENRTPGLMQGYSSNAGFGQIDYLSKSVQVGSKERVVTSGQGGIFPEGLPVGYVMKTVVTRSSAFQRAIVVPFIDYDRVEEVYVIKHVPNPDVLSLVKKTEAE